MMLWSLSLLAITITSLTVSLFFCISIRSSSSLPKSFVWWEQLGGAAFRFNYFAKVFARV